MPVLTILISTLNKGIFNLQNTVKIVHPEICYLIIHQNLLKVELPSFLRRDDITVITSTTKGLSKSRNIGLRNCKTEYALIADDDIEYIKESLESVIHIINTQKPDFASFKIKTPKGEPVFKNYLLEEQRISKATFPIASIEILLNVSKIKNHKISFDERFGLGTKLRQAEEEIFITDLMKKNFIGKYYPLFLVKHPYESTSTKAIKESQKYFLKGAYSQRSGVKLKIHRYPSLLRLIKNTVFFYLGRLYILSTKKTYL